MIKKTLLAAAAAAIFAGSAMNAMAADLRVGTHPVFAPFEFVDSKTGECVGFDMDIIREVSRRIGMEMKLTNMGFDGLIPALMVNSIDVAVGGITITEERKKKVDFTDQYYQAGQGVMIRTADSAKYQSLKDIEGKTVAVQLGTTGAEYAKRIPGVTVKAFNSGAEAFMDLKTRGSDVVITDRPVIGYFLVKNPKAAKGLAQKPIEMDKEYFGFCVKKGNSELLAKLNGALSSMKSDGTYDKLYQKWFGK